MANHSHRAGGLKQSNKKNKRSSASKRSRVRAQGGKIQSSSLPRRKGVKSGDAGTSGRAKADRANAARQRREASRKSVWNSRRGIGAASGPGAASAPRAPPAAPPRMVGIISLSEAEGPLEERVRRGLVGCADRTVVAPSGGGAASSVTASYGAHARAGGGRRPHLTLLANSSSFRPQYAAAYGEEDASVQAALDLCRVCDLVLFLIDGGAAPDVAGGGGLSDARSVASTSGKTASTSGKTSNSTAHLDHLISGRGDRILSAVRAQGLPTPVTVIVHGEDDGGDDSPLLGRRVGDDVMEDDVDEEDEEDEGMDEDTLGSLPNQSTGGLTHRSAKSIRRSHLRRRTELKRYASRMATTELGAEAGGRVTELDLAELDEGTGDDPSALVPAVGAASASRASVAALVRTLCTVAASPPSWVADVPRPYLVADGCGAARYDAPSRELTLTGYVRGSAPWNCNRLVHVPHLGTFAVKRIELAGTGAGGDGAPLPPIVAAGRKPRRGKAADGGVEMRDAGDPSGGGTVVAAPNPEDRESLEMFASPDALEGEQNLVGFDGGDDDPDDDAGDDDRKDPPDESFRPSGAPRPAGWSDYQSAWLDALGDEEGGGEGADEDRGELAFALNKKGAASVAGDALADDDVEVSAEERRALLAARRKDRADDLRFPDEVDREEETSAQDRFARYRAVKSFRQSYWDPKENLPETYGAVYHFSSFRATQRDVLGEAKETGEIVGRRGWGADAAGAGGDDDAGMGGDSDDEEEEAIARACVPPGAYVSLTLEGVPPPSHLSPRAVLAAVSLLPHENKVSVLHMGLSSPLSRSADDGGGGDRDVPVRSKAVLTFRCGWRTWESRPIFSQNNLNSDKHKFERYMPAGGAFFAGSVFGPVTYANCPTLVFREAKDQAETVTLIGGIGGVGGDGGGNGMNNGNGRRELVASGSIIGADADRIVLKRIVLTGFPTRVHKRHATVKYMFYNPEDVKWFQPAGITTKHGLQGNIVQSVGDHGVMKCLFNAPIKQHDTVCLPLYKRVFPKFAPMIGNEKEEEEEGRGSTVGGGGGQGGLGGKHFRVW